MLIFYITTIVFWSNCFKKAKITIPQLKKITILFWVLVFSFMYLVSVDAKDRSHDS